MGGALSSLINKATTPVDAKLDSLKEQLNAQANLLKQIEKGFMAEYDLFLNNLQSDKIVAQWPAHKLVSEVKIMESQDNLKNLVNSVADTASNITANMIGGIKGDPETTLKGSVKTAFNDIKDDLASAMDVFLGSQLGVQKQVSQAQYIIEETSIKMVYFQSYNTTLEASASDGIKKIGAYVYLMNVADINIFKSDMTAIVTKLGATKEVIAEVQEVVGAMRELLAFNSNAGANADLVPYAYADGNAQPMEIEREKLEKLDDISAALANLEGKANLEGN